MKRKIYLVIFLALAVLLFVGCSDNGGSNEGTAGESPGEMLTLDLIAKISDEWKSSPHQYGVKATEGRGISCGQCHDGVGFADREVYVNTDVDFAPAHQTGIDCQACHSGFGKKLLDTGLAELPFMDEPFKGGSGAVCVACHNGNANPAELFAQSKAGELKRLSYPHYGANVDLLSGKGGMEIPGVEYIASIAHGTTENSCVTCHMPTTADGHKNHTFEVKPEDFDQTCGTCHDKAFTKMTTLGGVQNEIKSYLNKLEQAILEATGAERIDHAGGVFVYYDRDGNEVTGISHEAYVATYNWQLVHVEGSYGIHNPLYAKSLIRESYKYLTGNEL